MLRDLDVEVGGVSFGNGLAAATVDDGLVVRTGTSAGDVYVTVEARDREPEPDLGPWERVVEVSLHSTTGRLCLIVEGATFEPPPCLDGLDPGHYRVRCHARGRDAGSANPALAEDEEPVEEHLVLLWKTPFVSGYAEATLKATDATGNF